MARHQSKTKNKMMIWAMAFAMMHRIPYDGSLHDMTPIEKASSLNVECFLPTENDFEMLRFRMIHIVSRIICTNLGHFQDHYSDCVVQHLSHARSEASKQQSTLVSTLSAYV